MASTAGKRKTASKRTKTSGSKKAPASKKTASKKTASKKTAAKKTASKKTASKNTASKKTTRAATSTAKGGGRGAGQKALRGPPPAGGDRSAKGDQPRTSRTEPLEVQGYYAFYIFAMTPRDMEKLELEIMSTVRGTPTPHPKSPKGTLLSILCRNPDEPPSKQPLILVDSEVCFGTSQQDAINRLNASFGSPANLELYKSHSQNFVQYVFIPDV